MRQARPPRSGLAVLDLDGTLYPGTAGTEFAGHLVAAGLANADLMKQAAVLSGQHDRGELSADIAAPGVYDLYAQALRGTYKLDIERCAAEYWTACRNGLFTFARPLVDRLHACGFTTLLLSGSPDELIRLVAADLGVHHAKGAAASTNRAGQYNGKWDSTPGAPGGKIKVLDAPEFRHTDTEHIAFAIGNTIRDAEVLHRTAVAIAFEPDRELAAFAASNRWHNADRYNILPQVSTILAQ